MTKPVVLIAEVLSPATLDALGPDFEVRHCDGADRSALLAALPAAEAVLIRSATTMDAEAISVAKALKVILHLEGYEWALVGSDEALLGKPAQAWAWTMWMSLPPPKRESWSSTRRPRISPVRPNSRSA